MFTNQQLQITALPESEHIEFSALDKGAAKEAVLSTLMIIVPLFSIITAILAFIPKVPINVVYIVASGLFVLTLLLTWWNIKAVRMTGIAVREHDVMVKRGIIWRTTIILPFNRIQHIETHRNPVERKLGLATLQLFTAGGAGADLEIHGLKQERASKVRQYILKEAAKDGYGTD